MRAHSQELSDEVCRQHIDLYVNEFTRDLGDDGMAAIDALLARAAGISRVINERSLAAVAAARLPGGRVRPLYDSYGFARIPGTLLQLFGERERGRACPSDVLPELDGAPPRVVAVLIDALGWAFVERFAERAPLLARLRERGRRVEVDDAISVDDDGARDDAAHGAAGRASTAPTSGSSTSRRSTASSAR